LNSIDWDKLSAAVAKARNAAQAEKAKDPRDGGSCNLDFAYISATGLRKSTAAKRGYHVFKAGWHGRVMKVYSGEGQADLNYRQVQVVAKVLQEEGFDAGVYYQLD
jgi:hypothetical protein